MRVTWFGGGLPPFSAKRQMMDVSGFVGYVILTGGSANAA